MPREGTTTQSPPTDERMEIVWPSNIGGYCVHITMPSDDGTQLFEDLSISEEDLHILAEQMDIDPDELRERLTVQASDLTLKQLIGVLDYIITSRGSVEPSCSRFEVTIAPIEEEFADQHTAPQ